MSKLLTISFILILTDNLKNFIQSSELFPLTIIHINDFHARYEPTDLSGSFCNNIKNQECIGGYARIVYVVKYLLEQQKYKNPLYLNAGDNFQGTLWYNVGRWNVTSQFLNMLPADAMVLGNHEFDNGIDGIVPFLETIHTKIVMSNMDASREPRMQSKFQTSIIIEKGGRLIGIIGVLTEQVKDLANIGNLRFFNESKAILCEGVKLRAQGANIIIVLSHCGLMVDKLIAQHAGSVVDVIVGGHSHSFLYTGDNPPGPMKPEGNYPTEIVHSSGRRVLIVHAGAYARYVGNITVYFDGNGNVVNFDGAPIYLDPFIPQDASIIEAMKPWKDIIDAKGNAIIGKSKVRLEKFTCMSKECNLGNFYCDSLIYAITKADTYNKTPWTRAAIALENSGGLRVPLQQGNLTYAHIITMSPFENTVVTFRLAGEKLLQALEYSVSKIDLANNISASNVYLQVAGLKVVYDYKRPPFQRVVNLKVQCADCPYPKYEPFNKLRTYSIITNQFLHGGGDGFYMLRDYGTDVEIQPFTELDALLDYTASHSPITTGLYDRIIVL